MPKTQCLVFDFSYPVDFFLMSFTELYGLEGMGAVLAGLSSVISEVLWLLFYLEKATRKNILSSVNIHFFLVHQLGSLR